MEERKDYQNINFILSISMKQKILHYAPVIIILLILSVLGYSRFEKSSDKVNMNSVGDASVCFQEDCIDVEVVDTYEKRQYWLMNRTHMDQDKWMLFIFEEERIYPFWMKNTLIPLDMIWISKTGKIIDIQTAQPCTADPCRSYIPSGSGLYVLELNAGRAKSLWLSIWTMSEFKKK